MARKVADLDSCNAAYIRRCLDGLLCKPPESSRCSLCHTRTSPMTTGENRSNRLPRLGRRCCWRLHTCCRRCSEERVEEESAEDSMVEYSEEAMEEERWEDLAAKRCR